MTWKWVDNGLLDTEAGDYILWATMPVPDDAVVCVKPEYENMIAAAPLMLAALEAVEWVDGQEPAPGMGGMMEQVCPWCDKVGTSDDGWAHNPGCIRQAAIAAARGE